MDKIGIVDVRTRLRNMPEGNINYTRSDNFREQADCAIKNRFPSQIIFCIECGLGDNTASMSEDTMFDLLDTLAEVGTESQLRKYGKMLNEYVNKTRDATQTLKYMKQKLGRAKSKITTKIQNNFDDLWNATNSTIGSAKDNFSKNTAPFKNAIANTKTRSKLANNPFKKDNKAEEKEAVAKEAALVEIYESLVEEATKIVSIDRILENYNRVSKRFNIDRIIQENTVANGVTDTAVEICNLIETYAMPVKARYNTALETVWYGLHKNGFTFNEQELVTTISDYYMASGNNTNVCKSILEASLIFDKGDYIGDIDVITEEEPEDDDTLEEATVFSEVSYINDKGEKVPKKCTKCGADVKVFLRGEPVFLCSNKDCEKYYGTVPFKEATIYRYMVEGKLTAKQRKNIKDSDYGIPSKKKYPMPDESHVRSAIQMFNHVDAADEAELAKNIKKKIKKYGMSVEVGKKNRFSKYYKETSYIIEGSARQALNKIADEIKSAEVDETDFEKIFRDYKASNDENKTSKLMALAKKLYSLDPSSIIDGTPNFLSYLRGILIIGGFAINPVLGVVSFIADQIVKSHMEKEELAQMRKAFQEEIRKTDKKIKTTKSQSQKENLQKYRDTLYNAYETIDAEYENRLTDAESDAKYDAADDDDIKSNTSFGNSEFDKFDDMFGDDFDIDDLEDMEDFSESGKFVVLMGSLLEAYKNDCTETSFDQKKCRKMLRMSPSIALNLVDVSKDYPSIISKKDLLDAIDDVKSDIQVGAVKVNLIERYDLNNAYEDLIRSENKVIKHNDIFTEASRFAAQIEITRALNDIYSACIYYSPLTEASFTNTVKLAAEKLKQTVQKMSDADKKISKNMDVTMNNFTKAAERAMTNDRREAIIKGSVIPSASKILKGAILTAATGVLLGPAVAVIGVLGYIGIAKVLNNKERKAILDEIEIELKMCQKYIDLAESKNDLKSLKKLYTIQRELEKQRGRIKYHLYTKGEHYKNPDELPKTGIES